MPLARIDEQHLAGADLTGCGAVVEQQAARGHDHGDRYRVAVLGYDLARLEPQPNDPHRPAVRDLLKAERARLLAATGARHVNIIHAIGVEGAARARGTVVVIDVLRSFTVSAYALAGGARECRLVRTVEEARALAAATPGSVICAEENALPIEGIPISNSPTAIRAIDLTDRVLIQRSTAGTQVAAAVQETDDIYVASLVVARATAQACLLRDPGTLTLVASADHPEDLACASYIESLIGGRPASIEELLEPLRNSDRYHRVMSGAWPGFPPTDLELALATDRFGFAMPITRRPGYLLAVESS